MADKLEGIKHGWHQLQTAREGSHAERVLPAALGEEVGYLIARLEAAEKYIEASEARRDRTLPHTYEIVMDAMEREDAAHKAWVAAKEET